MLGCEQTFDVFFDNLAPSVLDLAQCTLARMELKKRGLMGQAIVGLCMSINTQLSMCAFSTCAKAMAM